MFVWGKRVLLSIFIGLLMVFFGALGASAQDEVWLAGSLEEIKSASPMIGHATMPLSLAKAIVDAVPPKYLKESQEAGFEIPVIAEAVESMKPDDVFDLTIKDIHIVVRKFTKPKPAEPPAPSRLQINNPDLKLPIPLFMTGTAVTLLQYVVKEFKGMDAQLAHLIEQVKMTPPGLLLKGEDRLMNTWLEIFVE
ncbi:MAG: hypothetical protein JXR73_21015 [Candidatus Omnitrophica bacterium]|nr:hypothetical protein [Candidatus Omnitrophota bacterium]